MFVRLDSSRVLGALLGLTLCSLAFAQQVWPPAPPLYAEQPAAEASKLPPTISAQPNNNGTFSVRFHFKPTGPVKSVNLAGSFNGWNNQSLPMSGPVSEGAYVADLELGAGD